MKPTQEQIEKVLETCDRIAKMFPDGQCATLAAAYREMANECEMMQIRYSAAEMYHSSQIKELKSRPCDFCNETPQTENEKAYAIEFGNTLGDLPTMAEWLAIKQTSETP